MDFRLTDDQLKIADSARKIAQKFGPEYWMEKDRNREFPEEFWNTIGKARFPGIIIPEKYGGLGKGLSELIIAVEELDENGCGYGGSAHLLLSTICTTAILRHGSEEQKKKYLPKIARGEIKCCLALTEPDAGSNTLNIKTRADKKNDRWIVNGNKIFISDIDQAGLMLLIARTTPQEKIEKKGLGLSLFLVELPDDSIQYHMIPKHGMNYSKTFQVHIQNLQLSKDNLLGEEGKGWYHVLNSLNPERMVIAASAIGIAKLAIKTAVEYSKQRKVFEDPIGSYQGLQFPLANAYAKIEAARILNQKAAWLYDTGAHYREVGATANMAKVVAVDAAIEAVYHAMQIFGGYGYAVQYHVERWWREVNLFRLAPVTQQLALAFIGEHVLGMPPSYRR
jgi:acyl-CoA dehydrogenase